MVELNSDTSIVFEYKILVNLALFYNLSPITNISSLKELTIYLNHEEKHHIFNYVKVLEDMGISVQYTR